MTRAEACLSCEVLTDLPALLQIRPDWDALYEAMPASQLSDGFEWAQLSWEFVCRPRGREMFCVVARDAAGVVGILPLVVSRRQLWRIASPLGAEASEYCPFLVDPRADPTEVLSAIFRKLERVPGLHGLRLPGVREEEPLGLWLARRAGAARTLTVPRARIRFKGYADWDSYFATRSPKLRGDLRRKIRSAERLGELRFCEITDPQERQEVWRWMVGQKKAALARRGINDWVLTQRYVKFTAVTLKALARQRPLLAIKLDDAVVAAGVSSAGRTVLRGFVITFDERYGAISPGAILQLHCARWAFEHGFDFDLGLGQEAFKSRWANEFGEVACYAVALTLWGRLYVATERARRWLGLRMPQAFRARVRRLLQGSA